MSASLVGSEMCIRDRFGAARHAGCGRAGARAQPDPTCRAPARSMCSRARPSVQLRAPCARVCRSRPKAVA
eukprot:13605899-Alexandrium_andersonii.AAC.1